MNNHNVSEQRWGNRCLLEVFQFFWGYFLAILVFLQAFTQGLKST